MKDATNDFIVKIIGVVVALAIAVFGVFMYNQFKEKGNQAVSQGTDVAVGILESNVKQYARTGVTGAEVLNAISYFMDSTTEEIYILCEGVYYIYPSGDLSNREKKSETQDKLITAKTKSSSSYISPKYKYTGKIIYLDDAESTMKGIEFTRE